MIKFYLLTDPKNNYTKISYHKNQFFTGNDKTLGHFKYVCQSYFKKNKNKRRGIYFKNSAVFQILI